MTNTNMLKFYVTAEPNDFVIEVPASWKITFGAVNPGSNADRGYGGRDLHCLRLYEGTKLRGVFCDVRGIRDLGITLMRKHESQTGSVKWSEDSGGNYERNEKRETSTEFRLEPGNIEAAVEASADEDES